MAIKIPDTTDEKKFKYIETVLKRLARRVHKTVAVAVPPIPVTHYATGPDSSKVLFRYFFLTDCKVSKFMLAISSLGQTKETEVIVEFAAEDTHFDRLFKIKAGQNSFDLQELAFVKAGASMKIQLVDAVEVGEYWLGFLMDIDPGHSKIIRGTIDALEESTNAFDK